MTREGFKNIFDKYFDVVRNYIYYRSGNSDLATDIAQETFMRLWEKQLIIDESKVKALLFKISGDLFVSSYRKEKTAHLYRLRQKQGMQDLSPHDQLEFKETKQKYEAALAQLPEKQRVVFLMSRIDNMKYHEIADDLGLSVKAIEKRMKNALGTLRSMMLNR